MIKIGELELGDFPLLLAPMEDVSDPPFRKLCKEGGADLMFTEFISSEGLIRNAQKSLQKLDIFEFEGVPDNTVRFSASTLEEIYKDNGFNLNEIRNNIIVKPVKIDLLQKEIKQIENT